MRRSSRPPQPEPYAGKTANLRRRLQRLLGPPEQTRRLNLRNRVRSIEYTATGSDFEPRSLQLRTLRRRFPTTYSARLHPRFAPLVKLLGEKECARGAITILLGRPGGRSLYFG